MLADIERARNAVHDACLARDTQHLLNVRDILTSLAEIEGAASGVAFL